ncbi:cysteine-rich receptor-like protein kinase 44 [Salvia hispanica]|uniref:cysteine-rich receptor-like protein kinase 44 n=1 Tax=Salvia hispanica TaxID=49212 RepID=UPI002009B8C9|nr:cysteine-rich receptor-like protein kinase 44 [Salvia hispanica]
MSSQTCLLLILAILTNLSAAVTAQIYGCFGSNYTANSTYSANLISLVSSLPPNITDNGYYNATAGQAPDRVYATALCRTDFQLEECRSCLRGAIDPLLQSLCPNRRQGIFFRQACTLRYSDQPISAGAGAQSYYVRSLGVQNLSSPEQFNQQLRVLLRELRGQAAAGGPLMKIAAGNGTAPDFLTMFAMVQCVPDLSAPGCSNCLIRAEQLLCCDNRVRMVVNMPGCYLEYTIALSPFYNISRIEQVRAMIAAPLSPPLQAPATQSSPGNDDGNSTRTVMIILVPIVASLLIAACVGTYVKKRLKKKTEHITLERLDEEEDVSAEESLIFDFEDLVTATNNFSDTHKIGQGGFGAVYKGTLRKGQQIAVKRLSRNSEQGELEFKNEVVLMAKLQHRNLVRLLGFSLRGAERLLVYEFVQNGSLDCSVFDPMKRLAINWDNRFKIIKGIAKGLVYLHEDSRLRVIHRDLKASNVLLDEDNNPKISDFGMARLFTQDETRANTRRIVGTYGYMAPEYARNGHFSMKSDVFSFGVLVLEIISGQSNNSFKDVENGENVEYMLSFAWRNWRAGTANKMIDPTLMSASASRNDMLRCIHIGLLCVQENASDRPTMASVVVMLQSLSSTFPVPLQPGFFVPSSDDEIKATEFSRNEATISDLYPR